VIGDRRICVPRLASAPEARRILAGACQPPVDCTPPRFAPAGAMQDSCGRKNGASASDPRSLDPAVPRSAFLVARAASTGSGTPPGRTIMLGKFRWLAPTGYYPLRLRRRSPLRRRVLRELEGARAEDLAARGRRSSRHRTVHELEGYMCAEASAEEEAPETVSKLRRRRYSTSAWSATPGDCAIKWHAEVDPRFQRERWWSGYPGVADPQALGNLAPSAHMPPSRLPCNAVSCVSWRGTCRIPDLRAGA